MKWQMLALAGAFLLGSNDSQALDLWIDNIYVTQATQTYNKSVPLVAKRRGLVRIFTRADQANNAAPQVRLDLYYNGVYSKSVRLNADNGFNGVPTVVDSRNYTYSHDYFLDAADIRPGLQLHAEVDPDTVYPQSNYLNDVWPQGARRSDYSIDVSKLKRENVWTAPTYRAMLVPLHTSNGLVGDVNTSNTESYVDYLRRVLPVPEALDVRVRSPYYFNGTPGPNYDYQWTRVLNEMDALRYAENQPTRHYYAVLKPYYNGGGSGMAWIGGWSAVGVDWTSPVNGGNGNITWRSGTYAHEVGHNLGLRHAPCGGAAGADPYFPYYNGGIGVTGFDVFRNRMFNPGDNNFWTDLMGYCGYDWISDYHYRRALQWRNNNDWLNGNKMSAAAELELVDRPGLMPASGEPTPSAAEKTYAAATEDSLLIWGRIEHGRVVLEPAFRVKGAPTPAPAHSDYQLQALDQNGRVMAQQAFVVYQSDHGNESGFAFRMQLPKPARTAGKTGRMAPEFSELRLLQHGTPVVSARSQVALTTSKTMRPASLTKSAGKRVLQWDAQTYPVALVRNADTGEVLSFARDGRLELPASAAKTLDVQFGDGIGSRRQQFTMR